MPLTVYLDQGRIRSSESHTLSSASNDPRAGQAMAIQYANDAPVVIRISDEERDTGKLSDEHHYDAVSALCTDGLVVIENGVADALVDKMNARMAIDTERQLRGEGAIFFNKLHKNAGKDGARVGGNLSQQPPMEKEWMLPEFYANRITTTILSSVLGPEPELRYIRANVLVSTQTRQNVHADVRFVYPSHPFCITQNIPLIDFTPANGTTELWLGTQNHGIGYHQGLGKPAIAEEALADRRKIRPPIYPKIKKGSLVLRDMRMWHAGMPNPTDQIRTMLSFSFWAKWFKNGMETTMAESLKPTVEELERLGGLKIAANYIPDAEYDYLDCPFNATFTSVLKPDQWNSIKDVSIVETDA